MRVIVYFYYQFQLLMRKINFKLACQRANEYHRMNNGKQYFVIRVSKTRYTCICNDDKEFFRKQAKATGQRTFDYIQLCKIAAYKTPSGTKKDETCK
jgi:pantothenate kinase